MKRFLPALGLIVLTPLAGINTLGQHTKPQPSARDTARKVSLRCSPRNLWLGDILTLNMSVPHGRDFAILGPDNRFFWLRSWEPNDEATTARWYAFEKVRQLKIVTAEAKGRVSTDDEPIFTKTGWYRIRVSYNLETDDGTPVNQCRVYYTHRRRPARA
jgi:type IV secretory pathway ATPase VirB11/archaellum biosynthesis ATPase